jgi:hypothetical protein
MLCVILLFFILLLTLLETPTPAPTNTPTTAPTKPRLTFTRAPINIEHQGNRQPMGESVPPTNPLDATPVPTERKVPGGGHPDGFNMPSNKPTNAPGGSNPPIGLVPGEPGLPGGGNPNGFNMPSNKPTTTPTNPPDAFSPPIGVGEGGLPGGGQPDGLNPSPTKKETNSPTKPFGNPEGLNPAPPKKETNAPTKPTKAPTTADKGIQHQNFIY